MTAGPYPALPMDLGDFLFTVASQYDPRDGISSPVQRLLRAAPAKLLEHLPDDITARGDGGTTVPLLIPRVGFFCSDARGWNSGLHVVYLFTDPGIVLSINQGVVEPVERLGRFDAGRVLRHTHARVRAGPGGDRPRGLASALAVGLPGVPAPAAEE